MDRMGRIAAAALLLPESSKIVVESWDGEVTFRVRKKVFVFAGIDAGGIGVKLPKEEAEALCAADPRCTPSGYGLGRHGWVSVDLSGLDPAHDAGWAEIDELVETSWRQNAPKTLVKSYDAR